MKDRAKNLSIEVKVPYRIPLVGGFTDFPQFYNTGAVGQTVSCTINRFVTIALSINRLGGINIRTRSDLPIGVGLGSSGAFHAGLILALAKSRDKALTPISAAALAYQLETGINQYSTGQQDSLACLVRGITLLTYKQNNPVVAAQVHLDRELRRTIDRRLLLFDTKIRRDAASSIEDIFQKNNVKTLTQIASLPQKLLTAWKEGNLSATADLLNDQEALRSNLSNSCRSRLTDEMLAKARSVGAGARLAGAGLGCLLCYCPEDRTENLRHVLNLEEIRFSILW